MNCNKCIEMAQHIKELEKENERINQAYELSREAYRLLYEAHMDRGHD